MLFRGILFDGDNVSSGVKPEALTAALPKGSAVILPSGAFVANLAVDATTDSSYPYLIVRKDGVEVDSTAINWLAGDRVFVTPADYAPGQPNTPVIKDSGTDRFIGWVRESVDLSVGGGKLKIDLDGRVR